MAPSQHLASGSHFPAGTRSATKEQKRTWYVAFELTVYVTVALESHPRRYVESVYCYMPDRASRRPSIVNIVHP